MHVLCDAEILLLGIYPRGFKLNIQEKTWIKMFRAVLFIVVKKLEATLIFIMRRMFKRQNADLASVAQLVGALFYNQSLMGLIPCQSTHLGNWVILCASLGAYRRQSINASLLHWYFSLFLFFFSLFHCPFLSL